MRVRLKTAFALLPGQIIFTLAWLQAAFGGGPIAAPSFINNPDALVRLERIRQLLDGGDWFAPQLARVGALDHLVLHWSRPLDLLVAPFALAAQPFVGLTDAVLYAGIWISLPVGLVALSLGARLVWVCGERSWMALSMAALCLALLPFFHLAFRPEMWPDHHGLMVLLCIWAVLLAHRMLALPSTNRKIRAAWALGGVQALAVWISPESLVPLAGLNASFALLWIFRGDLSLPRLALRSAGGLSLGLLLALGVEYGTLNVGVALDRLSLFSLAIALALAAVWLLVDLTQRRFTTPLGRGVSGAGFAGLGAMAVVALNPNALYGPMAGTDSWFLNIWSQVYSDGFSLPISGAVVLAFVALAGGVWCSSSREKAKLGTLLLAPLVVGFCVLGVASSARWMIYAEVLSMGLIVASFGVVWRRLAGLHKVQGAALRVLAPVLLIALAMVDFVTLSREDSKADTTRRAAKVACNLDAAITGLNTVQGPLLVVAHANTTPAVLYFTSHRVSAVPIHPDADAVHASVDMLRSTHPTFDEKGVAIVICPADLAARIYGLEANSLHARLIRGQAVPGLKELGLKELAGGASPKNGIKIFTSTRY